MAEARTGLGKHVLVKMCSKRL